ncbi:hypothetical protein E2P47_01170 [Candidatus Bathyarchaeota archaeon]|nr:hypothetical protein E2P47_01170 [Candidatus Bathyarchaeota archaeon]
MVDLMENHTLVGEDIQLVIKGNVLAVLSSKNLEVISSAIHNGGCKKTKAIINTQVFDDYGDLRLHKDPVKFIIESSNKFGNFDEFVGMVTYASIKDFALVSKKEGNLGVSVIATAGCTHSESAGEKIEVHEILGTINIIIIINGNPTNSCLATLFITSTEAKTAALRDLDIRSRYSSDEATGTITDALVIAKTGFGSNIVYGGPASKLGNLVGFCTRKAVKEAVIKAKVGGFSPSRSVIKRLKERNLSLEKLASEASKIENISIDIKELKKQLEMNTVMTSLLLAAARLDDDFKKGLIPKELIDVKILSNKFSEKFLDSSNSSKNKIIKQLASVDLPPFTKNILITFLINNKLQEKNGNLK